MDGRGHPGSVSDGTGGTSSGMSDPSDLSANAEKDPADWTTGDEPMTGPQRSYLHTLAREAGEEVPDDLTKARRRRR